LAGEAFAKAVTTLARGRMLTPFGVARSDAGVDQPQQFVVSEAGKIDVAESVEAALQWLEDEAPNADVCMIILDGYFSSDDGRIDAVVGRALSLKRQLMVESRCLTKRRRHEGLEFQTRNIAFPASPRRREVDDRRRRRRPTPSSAAPAKHATCGVTKHINVTQPHRFVRKRSLHVAKPRRPSRSVASWRYIGPAGEADARRVISRKQTSTSPPPGANVSSGGLAAVHLFSNGARDQFCRRHQKLSNG
jgi:hypothetical protein